MDIDKLETLFANVEIIRNLIEEGIPVKTVTGFKKQWLTDKVDTHIMKM